MKKTNTTDASSNDYEQAANPSDWYKKLQAAAAINAGSPLVMTEVNGKPQRVRPPVPPVGNLKSFSAAAKTRPNSDYRSGGMSVKPSDPNTRASWEKHWFRAGIRFPVATEGKVTLRVVRPEETDRVYADAGEVSVWGAESIFREPRLMIEDSPEVRAFMTAIIELDAIKRSDTSAHLPDGRRDLKSPQYASIVPVGSLDNAARVESEIIKLPVLVDAEAMFDVDRLASKSPEFLWEMAANLNVKNYKEMTKGQLLAAIRVAGWKGDE